MRLLSKPEIKVDQDTFKVEYVLTIALPIETLQNISIDSPPDELYRLLGRRLCGLLEVK